jgi:hypothetical protein
LRRATIRPWWARFALPTLQQLRLRSISFAKRAGNLLHVSTPIRNKHAPLDIAVKTAVRPISDAGDVAVLHWVEVNVIDMPREIGFIADGMLPIAALPNAFLPLGNFAF